MYVTQLRPYKGVFPSWHCISSIDLSMSRSCR